MLSIQQLIKALRKLQNNTVAGGDLVKSIKHVAVCAKNTNETNTIIPVGTTLMTSVNINDDNGDMKAAETSSMTGSQLSEQQQQTNNANSSSSSTTYTSNDTSSQLPLKQQTQQNFHASHNKCFSLYSPLNADSSKIQCNTETAEATTQESVLNKATVNNTSTKTSPLQQLNHLQYQYHQTSYHHHQQPQRSQRIQNFFQQQIFHQFHTQHNQNLNTKQKQTQFAMSSLAAEPLTLQKEDARNGKEDCQDSAPSSSSSSSESCPDTKQQNSSTGKPCFNTGLADILQFMELIGNLKVSVVTAQSVLNVCYITLG